MRRPVILDIAPNSEKAEWEHDLVARLEGRFVSCVGPDVEGGCPLLHGERCPKLEKADGILFQLDMDRGEDRHLLGMYLRTTDVPIRVVVTTEQALRWPGLLDLIEVFTPPMEGAEIDALAEEIAGEKDVGLQ